MLISDWSSDVCSSDLPAAAVGGHVVGEHRVHQQRHVAEQVVEQVRLLDVVDLVRAPDPPRHREAAVGQVVEEVKFRQQALHEIGRAWCRERVWWYGQIWVAAVRLRRNKKIEVATAQYT